MATLTGSRLLRKNIPLYAATRLGNRSKRIPKRILDYSRFTTQLNFLRWSDRVSFEQSVNSNFRVKGAVVDSDEVKLYLSPNTIRGQPVISEQIPQEDTENINSTQLQNGLKPLFLSYQELSENDYIYRHIHKRLDRFAKIGLLLETLPIHSHINKLKNLIGNNCTRENLDCQHSINKLLSQIRDLIRGMNQQELAILLTAIKTNDEKEFRTIRGMVDIELRWLLKKHVKTRLMDLDLWFYLADIFYECLTRSTFVNVLVNYLTKEREVSMSKTQFLHLLFLVILQRNQSGILSNYEERILKILDKASFEDIATICMAYFKTATQIKNTVILRKIIDRTTEQLPFIDPEQPGYCSIIKSVRYSRTSECRENVLHLIMTLAEEPDCKTILTSSYNAVHTIKLMESYRIYDPHLIDLIACTMFENLDKYRIKDIQYALTSLSNFKYKDLFVDKSLKKNFDILCNDIISEARNDVDKQYYHLMPILRAFTLFGYYNNRFLDYVNRSLNDSCKLRRMRTVLEFDRSALLVYVATRLEGDVKKLEHKENLFKEISESIDRFGNMGSVRQDSSIKHLDFILRSTTSINFYSNSNLFRSISKSLVSAEGLQDSAYKFNFQYTLPHQNFADLVISKDCQEPGQFDAKTLMPKKVPAGQKHCLLYAVRKQDYVDGHERVSGYKESVSRLLTKLGYIVIHLDLNEPNIDNLVRKIKFALDDDCKGT